MWSLLTQRWQNAMHNGAKSGHSLHFQRPQWRRGEKAVSMIRRQVQGVRDIGTRVCDDATVARAICKAFRPSASVHPGCASNRMQSAKCFHSAW
jgi:hypothetical protein